MYHTMTYRINFLIIFDATICIICQYTQDKLNTSLMFWNILFQNHLLAILGISNNLYLIELLPQFNTNIFIPICVYVVNNHFDAFKAIDWLQAIATILYISSTEHPRDKSLTGAAIPCKIGPTASAPPKRCTNL